MSLESTILLVLGSVLLMGGFALLTYLCFSQGQNRVQRLFRAYVSRLERHTSFLMIPQRGSHIAGTQAALCLVLTALFAVSRSPVLIFLLIGVAAGPSFLLWKRHIARMARLERQLDAWLLVLANALKATSSLSEAIASTVALVPKPFSEEVDLLVKEVRLGAPLDRAVKTMSRRIRSPLVSGALAAIVVARQTGGNLPQMLERSSSALRESARLEGVLRAKTAEGRGQVLVLAAVPFLLCLIIAWLDRSWFDPMIDQGIGRGILASCAVAWIVATVWAHFIVKTDL